MDFTGAKAHILSLLTTKLPPELYYHCVEHTLDVYESTCRLISLELPADSNSEILQTAALWHDSGMIVRYKAHEETSVALVREMLPAFGYTPAEIDAVAGLIMVTKLPQRANTLTEQILCDADLDYLGRNDFYIHSFQLQLEWRVNNILQTTLREWLEIQVKFLSEHEYFTQSARRLREQTKLHHLSEINMLLSTVQQSNNT